jgi:hypothetical protein
MTTTTDGPEVDQLKASIAVLTSALPGWPARRWCQLAGLIERRGA